MIQRVFRFTPYRKRSDSPAPFRSRLNNTCIEEIDDGAEIEETDLAVYARYKQDGLLPEWTRLTYTCNTNQTLARQRPIELIQVAVACPRQHRSRRLQLQGDDFSAE